MVNGDVGSVTICASKRSRNFIQPFGPPRR